MVKLITNKLVDEGSYALILKGWAKHYILNLISPVVKVSFVSWIILIKYKRISLDSLLTRLINEPYMGLERVQFLILVHV